MYIVSACLLGIKCTYDGSDNVALKVQELAYKGVHMIPVCPEQLGGLPTPRPASEIKGGDGRSVLEGCAGVYTMKGEEVTAAFLLGAGETLKLARLFGVHRAILKEGSPSCGANKIRDGTFQKKWQQGDGVTAALLKKHGLAIFNEEEDLFMTDV